MASPRKPLEETRGKSNERPAKASDSTYSSATSDLYSDVEVKPDPPAKASDAASYATTRSMDNVFIRWIEVAKYKREEFLRSKPIRAPLLLSERDPNLEGKKIERHCTDVFGLFFLFLLLVVWIASVSYCLRFGDLERVKYGTDSCGNVCGQRSKCSETNFDILPVNVRRSCNKSCSLITEEHKYVEFEKTQTIVYDPDEINRTCVVKCSEGFARLLHKCVPFEGTEVGNTIFFLVGYERIAEEVAQDILEAWPYLAIVVLTSVVLCLLVLPVLRYCAVWAIWIVLLTTFGVSLGLSVYCWNQFVHASSLGKVDEHGREEKYAYLITCVGATITAINIAILTVAVKPKIRWVAEVYTQCAKANIALPRLIIVPISTCVLVVGLIFSGCYLAVLIESSGHLHHDKINATYEKDSLMEFTKWYNVLVTLMLVFFIIGLQDYIVASSVVFLFFSGGRNLGYPVFRSIGLAFRYHVGSIAVFSAITKLYATIAAVFSRFTSVKVTAPCSVSRIFCRFVCKQFFKILNGLNVRSYVTMSMFGMSFLESGKEAALITYDHETSLKEVLATGRHFILFVKVLVVMVGCLVGQSFHYQLDQIQHWGFMVLFTALLAYIIVICFVSVFELTLMALLICYCLDCQLHDGVEKPYFMNPELLAFVQKADLNLLNSKSLREVVVDKK